MEQIWKQFAEWGTALQRNLFFWARIKLTAIYTGIVALIISGFSFALYQSVSRNLIDASEDEFVSHQFHQVFIEHTLETLQNEIIFIDIFVLFLAAGMSYILAGYTLRPIQRATEAQQKFAENASHELRTPLAVMKNDMEVLLREASPSKAEIHSTLESSIEEIDRMSQMTEGLLLLARMKNHSPSMEIIDIAAAVNAVVLKILPIATHVGAELVSRTPTTLWLKGDLHSLERILVNIIQNSIQHSLDGGRIEVIAEGKGELAYIVIADQGEGIKEADLPHVFERFYKGEHDSGTGLGLAIVQELVQSMNGTISIHSIFGKGTKVNIIFPIADK